MKSLEINLISYEKQLYRYFNSASNFSSVVFLVRLTEYLLKVKQEITISEKQLKVWGIVVVMGIERRR